MMPPPPLTVPTTSNIHLLLSYAADLELEVDRLRRQGQFVQQEARETIKRIRRVCSAADRPADAAPPLTVIAQAAEQLAAVLRDLEERPGYHPAHDQVIDIAVRQLAEQSFRRQQRLENAPRVVFRLDLEQEHVEWFPARLRHIFDNILAVALRHRDPDKSESWVQLGLRTSQEGYEVRVSDNGLGLPPVEFKRMSELFFRAAPARAAGLGVGLTVVKLLVEQSGGSLTVEAGEGQGTTFVAVLPRYGVDDYLT